jgi:hypothetical protein
VPVAFDSAVAKREVDEAAREAALGHAVVSVLGDVHWRVLVPISDRLRGRIAPAGGRKT